ncbi:MAG: trypsin-like peptidase domain-containing protein [Deltaproteobacteria bacterium]|nr:trypsin-like peptidase domain-containing protein [Deltaproteobacteria bacterium]
MPRPRALSRAKVPQSMTLRVNPEGVRRLRSGPEPQWRAPFGASRFAAAATRDRVTWDGTRPSLWQRAGDPNQCSVNLPCPTPEGMRDIPVDVRAPGVRLQGLGADPTLREAIQKIAPATVFVRAFTGQALQGWSGSGVVLRPEQIDPALAQQLPPDAYLILTNHHVANGAKALTVTLSDGTELVARPLPSAANQRGVMDEVTDAALLVVRSPRALATATLGNPQALEQGEAVATAGHPKGLPRLSVTTGVVSQPRQIVGGIKPFPVIQFDAAINGGNSGGPLVNMRGEVVGLNTFTLVGSDDMSFAIPVDTQLAALRRIYQTGAYTRSRIGVELAPFPLYARESRGFPADHGAEVTSVDAKVLGADLFKVGDVVTDLTTMGGERFSVRMNGRYDGAEIDAWVQAQPPWLPVFATVYRPTVDGGKTRWEKKQLVLFPQAVPLPEEPKVAADVPVANSRAWWRGVDTLLAA